MATPAPMRARPQSATTMAAARPTARVSQPRRIAAAPATSRLGIAVPVGPIPLSRPQKHLADSYVKANRSENEHPPGLGLQPAVEQEPEEASADNSANQKKWQFCRHRELARELAGPVS